MNVHAGCSARSLLTVLAALSLAVGQGEAKGGRVGGGRGGRGGAGGAARLARPTGVRATAGGAKSTGALSFRSRSPARVPWSSVHTSATFRRFARGALVGTLAGRTRPYYYSLYRRRHFENEKQVCWFEAGNTFNVTTTDKGNNKQSQSKTATKKLAGYYYFLCDGTCCDVDCCHFGWGSIINWIGVTIAGATIAFYAASVCRRLKWRYKAMMETRRRRERVTTPDDDCNRLAETTPAQNGNVTDNPPKYDTVAKQSIDVHNEEAENLQPRILTPPKAPFDLC